MVREFVGLGDFLLAAGINQLRGFDTTAECTLSWACRRAANPAFLQARSKHCLFLPVVRLLTSFAAERGVVEFVYVVASFTIGKPSSLGAVPRRGSMFRDRLVRTPLAIAAASERPGAVRAVMGDMWSAAGGAVARWANDPDHNGDTPLHLAAKGSHVEAVTALLEELDVQPSAVNKQGNSPLHWAYMAGSSQVVEMLLARLDVDVGTRNMAGKTPGGLWSHTPKPHPGFSRASEHHQFWAFRFHTQFSLQYISSVLSHFSSCHERIVCN